MGFLLCISAFTSWAPYRSVHLSRATDIPLPRIVKMLLGVPAVRAAAQDKFWQTLPGTVDFAALHCFAFWTRVLSMRIRTTWACVRTDHGQLRGVLALQGAWTAGSAPTARSRRDYDYATLHCFALWTYATPRRIRAAWACNRNDHGFQRGALALLGTRIARSGPRPGTGEITALRCIVCMEFKTNSCV